MTKNFQGSFLTTSVLVATILLGFDSQLAFACTGGGSTGSGLSHGSSLGAGSVTVCVGSGSYSPGTSSTQSVTKTVTVKTTTKQDSPKKKSSKAAPKPASKAAAKPAVKPAPQPTAQKASCPSPAQMASMPRSADAAERWILAICGHGGAKATVAKPSPKPVPKVAVKQKAKKKTTTITETETIEIPGSYSSNADEVELFPNPLVASVYPGGILAIGQEARFSSNPIAHYGMARVLGRDAQVHFVPISSFWEIAGGLEKSGADVSHFFSAAGKYKVTAFVNYEVSYRLVGETNWSKVSGELVIESNQLEVLVGASSSKSDQLTQGALLVGEDCLGNRNRFGCQT